MEKRVLVSCDSAYCDFTFPLLPLSKKFSHWLLVVGGAIGKSKSDADDGTSLTFPDSRNYDVTHNILFSPPVIYLLVRYSAGLVDKEFSEDAVWWNGMFCEVDELVTHFIVTCDDNSTIFQIDLVMYREELGTTVTFFWMLVGVRFNLS